MTIEESTSANVIQFSAIAAAAKLAKQTPGDSLTDYRTRRLAKRAQRNGRARVSAGYTNHDLSNQAPSRTACDRLA
jgi:hypothetical protein